MTHTYGKEAPGLEEQYAAAVCASSLEVHDHRGGPVHLLVASGLSAKEELDAEKARAIDSPSIVLGAALARLQSQWHSVEKPQRRVARSIRQWIELLPLVQIGERVVGGKMVPIMSRDRDGAKLHHLEEVQRLEAVYESELRRLAQQLPARYWIRERLFLVAVYWGLEDPDRAVAEALRFWLDPNCPTCHGTGEIVSGEQVVTCQACEGRRTAPVPGDVAGRRLVKLMEESKHAWLQRTRATLRRMRRQVDSANG